jgi:hypothetical protein
MASYSATCRLWVKGQPLLGARLPEQKRCLSPLNENGVFSRIRPGGTARPVRFLPARMSRLRPLADPFAHPLCVGFVSGFLAFRFLGSSREAQRTNAYVNARGIVNESGRPAVRQFRGPAYRLFETDEFGAMQGPRLMLDRRRRETAKEPAIELVPLGQEQHEVVGPC